MPSTATSTASSMVSTIALPLVTSPAIRSFKVSNAPPHPSPPSIAVYRSLSARALSTLITCIYVMPQKSWMNTDKRTENKTTSNLDSNPVLLTVVVRSFLRVTLFTDQFDQSAGMNHWLNLFIMVVWVLWLRVAHFGLIYGGILPYRNAMAVPE